MGMRCDMTLLMLIVCRDSVIILYKSGEAIITAINSVGF